MSFFEFSMESSRKVRDYFQNGELGQGEVSRFLAAGERSIEKQAEIEAGDELSFDEYLVEWNKA